MVPISPSESSRNPGIPEISGNSHLEGYPRLLRVTYRGRDTGIRNRHHDVGVDRVFDGQLHPVLVDRQVGERHIGAFLGEFKCDGLADAAGCTRYDSHFSFE